MSTFSTKELLESGSPVKALTWKNPFAELMLRGKIETRSWYTMYRGLVLICAAKKSYSATELANISGMETANHILNEMIYGNLLERNGMAIAIGQLIDSRVMTKDDEAKCYVAYMPGLQCHIYYDVVPIEPFPWRGSQGWRQVPESTIKQIKII